MSQWQPIETAPTDGTAIDLWADGRRVTDCFWQRGWRQRYAEAPEAVEYSVALSERPATPTHWMPRPEAPKP